MDFQITPDNQGIGQLSFTKNTDLRTDIWLSIMTKKGSFFVNPDFGCEVYKIRKVTDSNLLLMKQYFEACLQWLITTGRATYVNADVVRDSTIYNRYDVTITVTQANGIVLYYELFSDVQSGTIQWAAVGGPDSNYMV